jgi:hypothetical protein
LIRLTSQYAKQPLGRTGWREREGGREREREKDSRERGYSIIMVTWHLSEFT